MSSNHPSNPHGGNPSRLRRKARRALGHCPLCGGILGDEKHTQDRVISTYTENYDVSRPWDNSGKQVANMWREEDYYECENCGAKADEEGRLLD